VAPATGERLALRPLPGSAVRISGGFWGHYQALNRQVTIPHGIRMLAETGSLENLRIATGAAAGEYSLPLFRDSDIYKMLEAIAWSRRHGRDEAAEQFFSDATGLLAGAQHADGYLNSYVDVTQAGRCWADPAMGHELYCAGHLFQAAVADLRTGGAPDGLAAIAVRYAGLLTQLLPGELAGFVPGHPEAEMALTELYRATGRAAYLELAAGLIARRGQARLSWGSFGPDYFSDDIPFEQADQVRGHAVRALYLLSGATDVYTETGRGGLLRAALAQWDDMVAGKTYLTGGIGARHTGESFGAAFELPPDQAYCETCAAVASIMWNWRLLLITGEARFADLIERTLYNGFLAGLGLDGRSFFYVNPLQSSGEARRKPWQECACCPPNIMRLLASLDSYVATSTDTGVQIHQFVTGQVSAVLGTAGLLELDMATGYPDDGGLRLRVGAAPAVAADLAVRLPAWAGNVSVQVNGRLVTMEPGQDGYLRLSRDWAPGDEVVIQLNLPVRTIRPDPRIDAVRGCVAFERGPLVYCFEGADLPAGPAGRLQRAAAAPGGSPAELLGADIAGHRVIGLALPGVLRDDTRAGWPYRDQPAPGPGPDQPARQAELRAVPYYAWANRGQHDMRVWLPVFAS
jgi:hypothetical protein